MDTQTETTALADVQARLSQRFPSLADEVIEAAVRMACASLDGPIRDYVPVLVEHIARDRLSQLAEDSSPSDASKAL